MDLLSICKDLIQIPSVTGNQIEIDRIVSYCQKLFQGTGAIVKVIQGKDVPPLLYIANKETETPDIAILGHLDVVPANPKQFIPEEKDGRLYGRGSLDMKSFAAVAFQSMLCVLQEKLPLSMAILLETDEEIGSSCMRHFVATHPNFIPKIVLDVDVGGDISKIIDKCKRAVFLRLTAEGLAAHGSLPWEGKDANERLIQSIVNLRSKFPYYSLDENVPLNKWTNTMHVGKIHGGETVNIICANATADLDFRLLPEVELDTFYKEVETALQPGVSYSVLTCGLPVVVPQENPILKRYKETAEKVLGRPIDFQQTGGATTSLLFAEKGSLIIYHSGSGADMHGANEYLELKTLYQLADIQQTFLREYSLSLKK